MNWLSIVLKYLPSVLAGVTAVEAAIKAPGATKKQIVLGAITAGAAAAEQTPNTEVAAIGALIDNVVGTLNATGVFAKSAA